VVSIFLLTLGSPSLALSGNDPFSLTISARQPAVEVGTDIEISVVLTNTSQRNIWMRETYAPCDYSSSVVDSLGHPAPETEYGLAARRRDNGKPLTYHGQSVLPPCIAFTHNNVLTIKPGTSIDAVLTITDLFDMHTPGTYTIQLERRIPRELYVSEHPYPPIPQILTSNLVRSNVISVTVRE